MGRHPGFVAVTVVEPDPPLSGVGCGGKDCNEPATLLLMVLGEIKDSDEPTFYPTCRSCVERMVAHVGGREIERG